MYKKLWNHREALVLLLGILISFVASLPAEERSPANDARIKAAIDKACRYIKSQMSQTIDEGHSALGAVALLKAGIPKESVEIQRAIETITKRFKGTEYSAGNHHYYQAGVSLMALANCDSKKYRSQIDSLARYLMDGQGTNGQWHYPSSQEGDTSISQYAILGLWEASRSGMVIPLEVWDRAASWHIRTQQRDGGFGYHPESGGMGSLHSMTVAGIGSLRIARLHLFPNARAGVNMVTVIETPKSKKNPSGKRFGVLEPVFRADETEEFGPNAEQGKVAARNASYQPRVTLAELDNSVQRGLDWLTKNFTVERPTGYPIYYLYGLERAAALSELKQIGLHDWYSEGAEFLITHQNTNQSWVCSSGEVPAACFGVLFLSKATSKMIRPPVRRVEFGTGVLVGGRGLPDDLKSTQMTDGKVRKPQKKTPLEELLTQLENPQIPIVEGTQEEFVEQVLIGDRNVLLGQVDRLKKLAIHPDVEIRRTAYWALGRSGDLRLAPILLKGMEETDLDAFVEARNALRCLSRRVEDFGPNEAPIDAASRQRELKKWQAWYQMVRAYEERNDLPGGRS